MKIKYKKEAELLEHYNSNVKYFSPIDNKILKELIEFKKIKLNRDSICLDIGCGTGSVSGYLDKNYDCIAIGVDYSDKRIDVAKNMYQNCRFICSDVYQYLKRDTLLKFDFITAFEFLEHLENPKYVIWKVNQILKPNGVFIGSVPLKHEYIAHLQYYKTFEEVELRLGVSVFSSIKSNRNSLEYAVFTL